MLLKHQISNIPGIRLTYYKLSRWPSNFNSFLHLYTDFLLLTKLDYVDLLNYNLLRAVGAMCPHLKHVVFNARRYDLKQDTDSDSDDSVHSETSDDSETPTEIESNLTACFNNWPKVSKICCTFPFYIV